MYKHVWLFAATILLMACGGKQKELTEAQKEKDFLYMYETLEANYPYFRLGKESSGIDWLANKEVYLEKVKSTSNDSTYIRALEEILADLHSGHVDISPTSFYTMYASLFEDAIEKYPEYIAWHEEFQNVKPHIGYWSDFLNEEIVQEEAEVEPTAIISNYKDTLLANRSIALMRIPSVASELMDIDAPRIDKFLKNLNGVNHLVIDIQGNGGGSDFYWKDLIVSRLISDTVFYTKVYALKNGNINRKFYKHLYEKFRQLSPTDPFYSKISSEFKNERYTIFVEPDTIAPEDPIAFDGKIHLLVDGSVFSSAEGLAYFAKATGWADVVGKRTHGDGVGSDPIVASLPESGILFRFPVTAGFNTDGSLNTEMGTTPDIPIEGKNRAERQKNFIDTLR